MAEPRFRNAAELPSPALADLNDASATAQLALIHHGPGIGRVRGKTWFGQHRSYGQFVDDLADPRALAAG